MSNLHSSLAFEDIEEQIEEVVEFNLITRHLSISNALAVSESQPQVVKVRGSITISF